jgi:hypothetical protein
MFFHRLWAGSQRRFDQEEVRRLAGTQPNQEADRQRRERPDESRPLVRSYSSQVTLPAGSGFTGSKTSQGGRNDFGAGDPSRPGGEPGLAKTKE